MQEEKGPPAAIYRSGDNKNRGKIIKTKNRQNLAVFCFLD